ISCLLSSIYSSIFSFSSAALAIHGLLFAAVHLVLLQSVSYDFEVLKVGPQLIWSGYDKLLVEASLMVFIAEFTGNTVYLKFLLSRVFLSAGLYTIVKNGELLGSNREPTGKLNSFFLDSHHY
ncbi:hypothetical protein FOZ63_021068, partial [Perkinsus olseni]